jgi:hypothetical protein
LVVVRFFENVDALRLKALPRAKLGRGRASGALEPALEVANY